MKRWSTSTFITLGKTDKIPVRVFLRSLLSTIRLKCLWSYITALVDKDRSVGALRLSWLLKQEKSIIIKNFDSANCLKQEWPTNDSQWNAAEGLKNLCIESSRRKTNSRYFKYVFSIKIHTIWALFNCCMTACRNKKLLICDDSDSQKTRLSFYRIIKKCCGMRVGGFQSYKYTWNFCPIPV